MGIDAVVLPSDLATLDQPEPITTAASGVPSLSRMVCASASASVQWSCTDQVLHSWRRYAGVLGRACPRALT